MSRSTKLTDQVKRDFLGAVRAGNYLTVSANHAGIHPRTVYKWLKRGEEEPGSIYEDFMVEFEKAVTFAEIRAVSRIQLAMQDDWRAALSYLERRFPDRWRKGQLKEAEKDLQISSTGSEPDNLSVKHLAQVALVLQDLGQIPKLEDSKDG